MKISLSWLKEFVPYAGTTQELDAVLTRAGLEVASLETHGADFPNVVVGQILESNPHPNADRLSVTRVDDGSKHPRQIVCGAKNYQVGDKVPVALPGAVLPGDFKIKVGKLRGVESEGMLCSAKELRLADDADGLLILPSATKVGAPISEIFPPDTVLEVEITSNRPDWLSLTGIAREVAANSGEAFAEPSVEPAPTRENAALARIEDPVGCPFYSVRWIRGVTVGPSPEWLARRLEAAGLRPINNVVDVTNYVMLELGQPLHAFDAAKVAGGIVVRRASEGEILPALDGREYALRSTDLVIADSARPLALAGVMGGEGSGVTGETTEILLESAYFDAPGVRATARGLNLHSDSSYRFERGVNPAGVLAASNRAAQLIVEIAGGTPDEAIATAGALPQLEWSVALRYATCRALLGLALENREIDAPLAKLGLDKVGGDAESAMWRVPAFRGDLTREVDLIEEVIRLVGIERISGRVSGGPAHASAADVSYDAAMDLRRALVGMGFSEARTSTLVARPARGDFLVLRNPLGDEQCALRSSLIGGLSAAVRRNLNLGAATVRLFELGRVFASAAEEEATVLGLIATGPRAPRTWRDAEAAEIDLFDLSGVLEAIAPGAEFEKTNDARFGLALEVRIGDFVSGVVGQLTPGAARALGARGPVVAAELRLDAVQAASLGKGAFIPSPRFPAVARDIAAVLPRSLAFGEIQRIVRASGEPLLADIEPFDIFTDDSGAKLPADRKSLAFSLTFRSPERTLTADEVNAACDRLRGRLRDELGIEFRE
ncbi:MAG: phenylalanine--tRNA ligase subunit beta [Terrimicrobiaceae bacterium]|nr:phenylalanine--tRNA ligase subunit beta [Terrimicrobiaceae bacterium]